MLKLKEMSFLCHLCKNSLNDNNSFNIFPIKNRKSIVTEAVSLIFEKLIHISPQILRSSSLSTLTSTSTCDNCITNLNQLIQLYKVLQETEIKIQQKFQWISQLIFQKEHDTPQTTDELQDEEHYLVIDEIKEELPDEDDGNNLDLDLDRLEFDGSTSLSPVITPLNLNTDDNHNDHPQGTLETKVRNCRKRRNDVNQNEKETGLKFKRLRKSQTLDKSQNYQPEVFNVHIQKICQTRNNQASLEDSYVFQLYDDSITTHYTDKSKCHKNTTDLPELRIVLQDFVNLIPSQVKKCLDPLVDCRFSVQEQEKRILLNPGGQGNAVEAMKNEPLALDEDGGRVDQMQRRDADLEAEADVTADEDEDLVANSCDGDWDFEEENDHSKTRKTTKTSSGPSKAPYFTYEEVSVLVDLYAKHSRILQGQLQGFASVRRRKWKEILDGVNAVGSNNRTLHQIKKKVKNLKHSVLNKSFGKTLVGSDDEDAPDFAVGKMLSPISKTQIHGVDDGKDIHKQIDPEEFLKHAKEIVDHHNHPRSGADSAITSRAGLDPLVNCRFRNQQNEILLSSKGQGNANVSIKNKSLPLEDGQGRVDATQRLDADLKAEADDIADNHEDLFLNSSDCDGNENGDRNFDEENTPSKTKMKEKTPASSSKAPNFTDEEVSVLVDLYAKNSRILQGQCQGFITGRVKRRKWKEILDAVNAIGSNNRTLHQIKKKIRNVKQSGKLKVLPNSKSFSFVKTGGWCTNDEKMLSTLRQYNQTKPVQGCKQMFPCDWCDQLFELRSRCWKHVQKKHRKEVEIISGEDVQHKNSLQGDD